VSRTDRIIGIYRITNLQNDKFYIGQSRNIFQRWKQHTSFLPENFPTSRIRAAFNKYGLNKVVHKEGTYGNFKFEILEFCEESELLQKEKEYIEKLKPQYNCSLLTPGYYYRGNHINAGEKKIWIQYHNYDDEKAYPSQESIDSTEDYLLTDCTHYISSRKRSLLYTKGDTIYLVLGKTFSKAKRYFLWTKTIVEEIDFLVDEELVYNAFGKQSFINPPQYLNNIEGFKEFRIKTGNFGLGLINISNWTFTETLEEIAHKNVKRNSDNLTYKNYIHLFETNNNL